MPRSKYAAHTWIHLYWHQSKQPRKGPTYGLMGVVLSFSPTLLTIRLLQSFSYTTHIIATTNLLKQCNPMCLSAKDLSEFLSWPLVFGLHVSYVLKATNVGILIFPMSSLTSTLWGRVPGWVGWADPSLPLRRCTEPVKPEHVMMQKSLCWTPPSFRVLPGALWFSVNQTQPVVPDPGCFPVTQSSRISPGKLFCKPFSLVSKNSSFTYSQVSLCLISFPSSFFVPLLSTSINWFPAWRYILANVSACIV